MTDSTRARTMSVMKRNGSAESVSSRKLVTRLSHITRDLPGVDVEGIANSVAEFVSDGVRTDQLDDFIASKCAELIYSHPDYDVLATRVAVEHMHKVTDGSFVAVMRALRDAGRVSSELVELAERQRERIEGAVVMARDFDFDYFGLRTITKSYLMSCSPDLPPCERPQHMFMRVALGIHGDDVDAAIETYDLMTTKHFVHATPTLFQSGAPPETAQLSSCYLLEVEDDSIEGIFNTMADCAQISKRAGGLGVHIHKIRAKGTTIASTGGTSTGVVPMLRVFNNVARYVNQGGRRAGSIAMYLEPWHADVEEFLELRRNGGHAEDRCRDLFTAIWANDEFFRRVQADEDWSLMCPHQCPGLIEAHGAAFDELYRRYEAAGRYVRRVRAKALWEAMLTSQIETGTPYLCSKDAANAKSNHAHLGTIKSSNLCNEIYQFTSPDETAVCNLASICLPTYVRSGAGAPTFDFDKLEAVVAVVVRNLNKVIDRGMYPTAKARRSNLRHRPMGVGVQGLADTFARMGVAYDSPEAYELEREIFRSMYYAAVRTSCDVAVAEARKDAPANEFDAEARRSRWPGAHASFAGSPVQLGRFQFDMWPESDLHDGTGGDRHDWTALRDAVAEHGVRNSLLIALMPTASTSQIMGFNETMEPFSSMLFRRKTLAGEFAVLNKALARELIALGLWDQDLKDRIMLASGSIQDVPGIPDAVKRLYKTVWDVRQRHVIDHAANRGPYVCQSQSMNLHVQGPTLGKMTNMHMHAWARGLKSLSYYVRVQQAARGTQFTISPETARKVAPDEPCEACSA